MAASGATIRNSSSSEARRKRKTELILRHYFFQLTEGCRKEGCVNSDCATGSGRPLTRDQAAAKAIELARSRGKEGLCVPLDGSTSKSSSTASLTNNTISKTPSSVSNTSSVTSAGEPPPERRTVISNTTPEPMETAATEYIVPAASSTESIGSSSPLILIHSRASTGDTPPVSRRHMPDPSGLSASSSSESGMTGPTGLTTTTSASVVSVSLSRSTDDTTTSSDSLSNISMDTSSSDTQSSKVKSSVRHLPSDTHFETIESHPLTEALVIEAIELAQSKGDPNYKRLCQALWVVFGSPKTLNKSFLIEDDQKLTEAHRETGIRVDLESVRRMYNLIFDLEVEKVKKMLDNVMDMYKTELQNQRAFRIKESLNHFVTLLENPLLSSPEFFNSSPKLLKSISGLPVAQKETLCRWYSHYRTEELQSLMSSLHLLITLQLLRSEDGEHRRHYIPQSDSAVASATSVMNILFFANLLKAKREGNMRPIGKKLNSAALKKKPEFVQMEDNVYEQLLARLEVHPALVIKTPIPLSEFINEELNERISMFVDYERLRKIMDGEKVFAFLEYPFILTTTNKTEKLFRDNILSMYHEQRMAVMHSIFTGVPDLPFLVIRVNRHDIVSEALVQLEAISDLNPIDLRKQLRVEFDGEEGIDEGGLQKEFFQLLVEKLFDPMNGMFVFDEDTQQHWFNVGSFESDDQYRLIGLLLGLAIYNNIILDIRFPMVVYRKLIGCPTHFQDLYSSHPQIAQSLQSMLEYDDASASFEDTFMATFRVSFSDVFGTMHTHDLKEGGDSIPITKENCQEYVDLYTDWLLNSSIAKNFDAFKRGFDSVMSQVPLADLFTAEEIELLVCGSNEWDIDALEQSTRYDGFTAEHPVIVNFWKIVREFDETQKKQLLAFVTGSDRIPLGGLAKLKFIIVKNGPDSDRLPTAHTCFNALMLCNYSSQAKLRDRLTKAITHAKGFGMI